MFDSTYIGAVLRITAETQTGERFQVAVNNPDHDDLLEEGTELNVRFSLKDPIVFPKNE